MNEKAIIQNCIEALAEQNGIMRTRAECEAKNDRYVSAAEFQTLAAGIGLAINRLEEMKAEIK